ncbi:unnamed protein product [Amaranthus hypochondriacus]
MKDDIRLSSVVGAFTVEQLFFTVFDCLKIQILVQKHSTASYCSRPASFRGSPFTVEATCLSALFQTVKEFL